MSRNLLLRSLGRSVACASTPRYNPATVSSHFDNAARRSFAGESKDNVQEVVAEIRRRHEEFDLEHAEELADANKSLRQETEPANASEEMQVPLEVGEAWAAIHECIKAGEHSKARIKVTELSWLCTSESSINDISWDKARVWLEVQHAAITNEMQAGDYEEALRLVNELCRHPLHMGSSRTKQRKVECLLALKRDAEVLDALMEALPLAEEIGSAAQLGKLYHDIGMQHWHLFQYAESVPWFEKATTLFAQYFGEHHSTTSVARTNLETNRRAAEMKAASERCGIPFNSISDRNA